MSENNGTKKIAGIGNEAVKAKTGRTWHEWIDTLDKAGGRAMSHQQIAALLSEKFGVPSWWTQMVTVGYEQAIGKRARGQKADGFAATASKTLDLSPAAAFKAFHDSAIRKAWLKDKITIRKATAPRSLRITWKDGKSHVDVGIYPKGARRSQVSLQHSRLASARTAEQMKAYWRDALARLESAMT
jgi:hypothetical protein